MRVLIWLIIVLLFGYMLVQLYQAWRLGEKIKQSADSYTKPEKTAVQSPAEKCGAAGDESSGDGEESEALFVFDRPAAPAAGMENLSLFEEQLQSGVELQQLRQDMAKLQQESAELRRELAAVREQLNAMANAQTVSPEYNEALVLARRGLSVETIAGRCGISVAEAELVHSLVQQKAHQLQEKGS